MGGTGAPKVAGCCLKHQAKYMKRRRYLEQTQQERPEELPQPVVPDILGNYITITIPTGRHIAVTITLIIPVVVDASTVKVDTFASEALQIRGTDRLLVDIDDPIVRRTIGGIVWFTLGHRRNGVNATIQGFRGSLVIHLLDEVVPFHSSSLELMDTHTHSGSYVPGCQS